MQCHCIHLGKQKIIIELSLIVDFNCHELSLLSISRSLHVIRFLCEASRSIFIRSKKATESPQMCYRSPMVVPKLTGNFIPDLAKYRFSQNFLHICLRICSKIRTFAAVFTEESKCYKDFGQTIQS